MAIIITKPERATSSMRTAINELMYSVGLDAQRDKQIEALLIERDQAIAEAYKFPYGIVTADPITGGWFSSDVPHVASEVIALKERYAKKLRRLRVRHERFKTLTDSVPQEEKETLIRAFCTDLSVDEQDVKKILRKHYRLLKDLYGGD